MGDEGTRVVVCSRVLGGASRTACQTKDRTYQNAVLLNNSPPTKQSASRVAKAGAEKYFLYDACLELKHQVAKCVSLPAALIVSHSWCISDCSG